MRCNSLLILPFLFPSPANDAAPASRLVVWRPERGNWARPLSFGINSEMPGESGRLQSREGRQRQAASFLIKAAWRIQQLVNKDEWSFNDCQVRENEGSGNKSVILTSVDLQPRPKWMVTSCTSFVYGVNFLPPSLEHRISRILKPPV